LLRQRNHLTAAPWRKTELYHFKCIVSKHRIPYCVNYVYTLFSLRAKMNTDDTIAQLITDIKMFDICYLIFSNTKKSVHRCTYFSKSMYFTQYRSIQAFWQKWLSFYKVAFILFIIIYIRVFLKYYALFNTRKLKTVI